MNVMTLMVVGLAGWNYHRERNHQGLGNELIERVPNETGNGIESRERLGGLLRYYYRAAA